jgi:DNA repair protein RecN (Recombination protein N)
MLTELRIDNFAIIPHLELEFGSGLITFTGETGAGKSIILDAIEAVLGGRSDATSIRSGAERATVEATFRLTDAIRGPVNAILEREDLLDDPNYLVMGRDLRREGRSTARINGRSVHVSLMKELGGYLVDIHGQSEHLSLLDTHHHIGLLDRYSASEGLLAAYSATYQKLLTVRRELSRTRGAEQDASRRIEMLKFQVDEIDSAHLRLGEEEELRTDRTRLANAENLSKLSQQALAMLDEGTPETPSITDLAGQLQHIMNSLNRIDPSRGPLLQSAETVTEGLSELARDLRSYTDGIEFNSKRLDQIEERLNLIINLKRKYGGSIESILAFSKDANDQLETITHASERIAELEVEEKKLLDQLAQQGQALSDKRRKAADTMGKAIETQLADLSMTGARFNVDFQMKPNPQGVTLKDGRQVAFDVSGLDQVEFLVAPNPGEGLKPLVKIASGGETSRLMLALKNVLADADTISTLVFDEIDQGIGGRVGLVVGKKLWQLSRDHQVLCITHLPQLAAYGNQHFRVAKQVADGRTYTQVEALQGENRRKELALMLGGITEGTLRSADEILQTVASSQH